MIKALNVRKAPVEEPKENGSPAIELADVSNSDRSSGAAASVRPQSQTTVSANTPNSQIRSIAHTLRGKNELAQGLILLAEGYIESVPAAEKFRILRAKLDRMNLGEQRFQAIAVTSAVPSEGKSVMAVNLARALSNDPAGKTLLIDCDPRKPTAHRFFRLSRDAGLSDALFSRKISNSFIKSVAPGLDVMTAGSPVVDAAQTLDQPELPLFIAHFKRYYRYIVLDCPPALLCPEPITLSTVADTTLLVVRAWRTDKRLVKEAVNALGKEKLLGVIMNEGIDPAKAYLDYGYYGYYADNLRSRNVRSK